jgi:hypothetical protein
MFRFFLSFFFFLFFVSSFVSAAQLTCSPQRILEISDSILGTSSTTTITITSPITNCHLYIHDLSVATITIESTATISSNSNITIRNVSSPSSTSPFFMIFDSEISGFGFINISHVSRRNVFNPTPESDFIGVIRFTKNVIGKSRDESFLSISFVTMSNVFCNRVTHKCEIIAFLFERSVANINTFSVQNVIVEKIKLLSSNGKFGRNEATR